MVLCGKRGALGRRCCPTAARSGFHATSPVVWSLQYTVYIWLYTQTKGAEHAGDLRKQAIKMRHFWISAELDSARFAC